MLFNKLKLFLEQKYHCVLFKNLDDYLTLPITQLYADLKIVKKDTYENHDRILFYTLAATNKELIFHLQQTIALLEIPNYFVQIVSNQSNLTQCLTEASLLHTADQDPILAIRCSDQTEQAPVQTTNFNIPKTVCVNPWINLFLDTAGLANPCCIYQDPEKQLSINTQTFDEITSSQKMKKLRVQLLNGKQPVECQQCWNEEANGKTSKRLRDNYVFKQELGTIDWNQTDKIQVRALDIKLGNTCNLACTICSPDQSTTLHNEVKRNVELQKLYTPSTIDTNWVQDRNSIFWTEMKSSKDSLTYIQLEGGEPLLVKRHFEILEFYVEQNVAHNINLHYNTNGSIFPYDKIPTLDKFNKVEFTLSIDNLGKKFEYERYGASWESVYSNILEYSRLNNSKYTVNVLCTLSALNLADSYDLHQFFKSLGISVEYNLVYKPLDMSINVLTEDAKKYILSKISVDDSEFNSKIDPVIKQLTSNNNNLLDRFNNRINVLDKSRQQKFSDTYPELYNFLRKQ